MLIHFFWDFYFDYSLEMKRHSIVSYRIILPLIEADVSV